MDLCLRKTQAGKSRDCRDVIVFEKFFQKVLVQTKTKTGIFKFLWFEVCFRKAPFRDRLV